MDETLRVEWKHVRLAFEIVYRHINFFEQQVLESYSVQVLWDCATSQDTLVFRLADGVVDILLVAVIVAVLGEEAVVLHPC